jgi:Arc/MetJ-type ribon-helix-helix transcriptional regulator
VVNSYHMKYTSNLKRTSMSLDTDTLDSIESLAQKWQTSKSEVIRRAVRKIREDEAMKAARMTPVQALEWLQENGISQAEADTLMEEVRLEREAKKYWWE